MNNTIEIAINAARQDERDKIKERLNGFRSNFHPEVDCKSENVEFFKLGYMAAINDVDKILNSGGDCEE